MLHIVTWLWGTKWQPSYATKLFSGINRNLKQEHRCVLMADKVQRVGSDASYLIDEEDEQYLSIPGCLVRMRMFDQGWQERIGAKAGDRIVNIDIDCVITGQLDELFDREDEFIIMQHFNSTNPCPFNGSLWMFRAGERHDVWNDFGPKAHDRFAVPIHAIADDQGWLAHKFPNAAAYTPRDGVYCFKKRTWETGKELPSGARVVAFPGRAPEKYQELDWVRKNWII